MRRLAAVFAFLFILPIPAYADFTGRVVGVSDGDTIKVMHDGKAERIRLNCIDAPEKGQPFGTKAKQFMSDQVFGKDVTIIEHGHDKYGRTIGDVMLEGTNVNQEIVKAGLAWWYRKYCPNDDTMRGLEEEARKEKRGLWADKCPIAPWNYRHKKYDCDESVFSSARDEHALPEPPLQCFIHGNKKSLIYHRPDCQNYGDIHKGNLVCFADDQEAKAAGYREAKNCP